MASARLGDFDKALSLALSAHGGRHSRTDEIAKALTELGKTPVYLAIILAVGGLNGAIALALLAMLVATETLNKLLKALVRRERPFEAYQDQVHIDPYEGRHSFPSAHAQAAAAIWGSIGWFSADPLIALPCLVLILAIGWSRIHLAAHFPSDVLGGWLIGGCQAAVLALVFPLAQTAM